MLARSDRSCHKEPTTMEHPQPDILGELAAARETAAHYTVAASVAEFEALLDLHSPPACVRG